MIRPFYFVLQQWKLQKRNRQYLAAFFLNKFRYSLIRHHLFDLLREIEPLRFNLLFSSACTAAFIFTSAGSSVGPQSPDEQHIGGS